MDKYTIDVTETITRRYVVLADSYSEAIEAGMSPLVELQDVSDMSALERIRNFRINTVIVEVEQEEEDNNGSEQNKTNATQQSNY